MPQVKILVDYGAAEGYRVGDVVDMTNPYTLIEEGKVELVDEVDAPAQAPEPIAQEPVVETPVVDAPPADVVATADVAPTVETPAVEEAPALGVDTTN